MIQFLCFLVLALHWQSEAKASESIEPFFCPDLRNILSGSAAVGIATWQTQQQGYDQGRYYRCVITPVVSIKGSLPLRTDTTIQEALYISTWEACPWHWVSCIPSSGDVTFLALEKIDGDLRPFEVEDPNIPLYGGAGPVRFGSCIIIHDKIDETIAGISLAITAFNLSVENELLQYHSISNVCAKRLIIGDLFKRDMNSHVKMTQEIIDVIEKKDEPLHLRFLAGQRSSGSVDDIGKLIPSLLRVSLDLTEDPVLRSLAMTAIQTHLQDAIDPHVINYIRSKFSDPALSNCTQGKSIFSVMYNGNPYSPAFGYKKVIETIRLKIIDIISKK